MQSPKILRSRITISEYAHLTKTAVDVAETEYDIRCRLAEELLPELIKLIEVQKVPDYANGTIEFYGELFAMARDDYFANYGTHYQRRGIADGTMAIMKNGNWMIVASADPAPPIPTPKPKAPAKPKPFDPTEYLRNRVSELQNGNANN